MGREGSRPARRDRAPALAPAASAAAQRAPGGQGGATTTARLAPASSIICAAGKLAVRPVEVRSAAAGPAEIAEESAGTCRARPLRPILITRPRPLPACS